MHMRASAVAVLSGDSSDGNCGHGAVDVPVVVYGLHVYKVCLVDHNMMNVRGIYLNDRFCHDYSLPEPAKNQRRKILGGLEGSVSSRYCIQFHCRLLFHEAAVILMYMLWPILVWMSIHVNTCQYQQSRLIVIHITIVGVETGHDFENVHQGRNVHAGRTDPNRHFFAYELGSYSSSFPIGQIVSDESGDVQRVVCALWLSLISLEREALYDLS